MMAMAPISNSLNLIIKSDNFLYTLYLYRKAKHRFPGIPPNQPYFPTLVQIFRFLWNLKVFDNIQIALKMLNFYAK